MTDHVFLFGSFSEDEAKALQSPDSGSPCGRRVQAPMKPARQNGSYPTKSTTPAVVQNGHVETSKSVSSTNGRVPANGKPAEDAVDALGRKLGQIPKKQLARPGIATTTGRGQPSSKSPAGGVNNVGKPAASKVPRAVGHVLSGSPDVLVKASAGNHAASDPNGNEVDLSSGGTLGGINGPAAAFANGVAAGNGEQAEWFVVNSVDVSSARDGSESNENSPVETVRKISGKESEDQGSAGTGIIAADKNGSDTVDDEPDIAPPKLPPKSWAAAVAKEGDSKAGPKQSATGEGKSKGLGTRPGFTKTQSLAVAPITALSGELWLKSLREAEVQARRLQPRGLINTGNSCFLNSILQAMVSCSAFAHLLRVLKARSVPEKGFPTLRAFVEFSGEFEFSLARSTPKNRRDGEGKATSGIDVGKPFAPAMFDSVLQSFTPDQPPRGTGRNRQEDAQEFLSFVIDRMHEEILQLEGKESPHTHSPSLLTSIEDEDWEMVGPKNRSAVTRTHAFSESAITDIFGGQLRSVVKTKGNKASATVQPFLVLHLDIVPEVVHSVEDALRFFAAPESLEGYKSPSAKVGEVVSASKSVKIQSLPRVLILHLMRFSYGSGGSNKLHKPVQFPLELILGRELLSLTTTGTNEIRKYELLATVSHHGKDPSVGHYTADSKQASGQWLRFDDGVVSGVGVSKILQEQAYLLFYKRTGF